MNKFLYYVDNYILLQQKLQDKLSPKLRLIHNVNFQRKLAIFESFTKLKAVEISLGVYRLIDFENSNGTYPSTINFQELLLLVEDYLELHNLNSEA